MSYPQTATGPQSSADPYSGEVYQVQPNYGGHPLETVPGVGAYIVDHMGAIAVGAVLTLTFLLRKGGYSERLTKLETTQAELVEGQEQTMLALTELGASLKEVATLVEQCGTAHADTVKAMSLLLAKLESLPNGH